MKIKKIIEKVIGTPQYEMNYLDYLKMEKIETYLPLSYKIKYVFLGIITSICIFTPGTNWMLLILRKLI